MNKGKSNQIRYLALGKNREGLADMKETKASINAFLLRNSFEMYFAKFVTFGFFLAISSIFSGCITTHSDGFVNYKAVGDVYGTKPQAVDYEEIGQMKADASGFFWSSCDNICKEAITDLKYKASDRGGDSIIDLSYEKGDAVTKAPSCSTHWSWGYLYVLPLFGPWVKTCDIEGVAVSRRGQKSMHNQAQQNQINPPTPNQVNININNSQQNQPSSKPSH